MLQRHRNIRILASLYFSLHTIRQPSKRSNQQMNKFSMKKFSCIGMRIHANISSNIHFHPTKFYHDMLEYPIRPNIILNQIANHVIQFYDHRTVIYCIPNYHIHNHDYSNIQNLPYDHMMVIKLYYVIDDMIKNNIWKDWMAKHVVIKFGWMKMNICGDIDMCSHVNTWKFFHGIFFLQSKTLAGLSS